ncbi:uncharacterized protein LOC117138277 isoform X2 [Drosophila mauritiana]|uniref:Phosphatidylinositol-glycan biosynthesis class X protein n=1 Tax=Drosophila mauritiana TaxID=7226 RepID=A0A6P8JIM4_DROMA|nr:uncharacterized protein LOC117138277 isoform X2 [Drosophila mauritiana]
MHSKRNNQCLLLTLVLGLLGGAGHCYVVEPPIVHVEMDKAGMHRTLNYRLRFDIPLVGKDCEYVLLQDLPASVYISTDELDDLQRLKRLNAIYPKFVNIEVATERAQPFSVLLRGTPKITESLALPLHFRYHAPSDKRCDRRPRWSYPYPSSISTARWLIVRSSRTSWLPGPISSTA